MIRTYKIGPATIRECSDGIHTTLLDGSTCSFAPPHVNDDPTQPITPDFLAAAAEMGYSDPWRYAVEHEIAHHVVAIHHVNLLGGQHWIATRAETFRVSRVVYRSCHGLELNMQQPESAAEEHLVNRLQRYMNMGAPDPYGELERVFGERLPMVAAELLRVARPWMGGVA